MAIVRVDVPHLLGPPAVAIAHHAYVCGDGLALKQRRHPPLVHAVERLLQWIRDSHLSQPSDPRARRKCRLPTSTRQTVTPRRALSASSSDQSTPGSFSPNVVNHWATWGSSSFHSSVSTRSASATSSALVSSPVRSSAPGAGTCPIGVSIAEPVPSRRSTTHLSTREFSPNPGHRNRPSSPRRNQFT